MCLVMTLQLPFIFWVLATSVVQGSDKFVCRIKQTSPYYFSKCWSNDTEQFDDIPEQQQQETFSKPQRPEWTPQADELTKVPENYRTIQNQIEQSNSRMESFEGDVISLRSEYFMLNRKLLSAKRKFVLLQSKTIGILDSTRKDVAVLNLTATTLIEGVETNKNNLFSQKLKHSTTSEKLDSFERGVNVLKSEISSLYERLDTLNGNINSLHSEHSSLKLTFTQQSESTEIYIEKINKNYQQMQRNLTEIQTNFEKNREDVDTKLAQMQKKIENGEMIFVVLSFAFAFWVAFSKMKSNPSKENTPVLQSKAVQAEPATECFDESTSIANSKTSNISMVRKRKSMDNSIGVVSFSRSGSDVHKELIQSVRSLTKLSVEIPICHSVVTRAEDICRIPPSKVVFVFVDANKRHIILEDPDQEIGNFRRQTVDAIKDIGCDVFVVYVRDKALDDNSLYHPRLTSIQRHHTLTSLSDTNRVLSLNTTFSEYQRDFLVNELQNAFNCSKTGII